MNLAPLFLVMTLFLFQVKCTVIQLIKNNVIGPAINFETFNWPTDPDAGLRRRKEYEEINGRHGFKHVERLGLGEDGRDDERRTQQMLKDEIDGFTRGYL